MNMIPAAHRQSTKQQYLAYIRKWEKYCSRTNITYCKANVTSVLEFLASLHYDEGLSYSAINCARFALSAYLWQGSERHSVGSHPLVTKLMRGIFNTNPPRTRYSHTWDLSVVLHC